MPVAKSLSALPILKRQATLCAAFGLLIALIVGALYAQSRRREWTLRMEQAKYRLEAASELITNQVAQVRADALFLADLQAARAFVAGDGDRLDELAADFQQFVRRKPYYDQIRLLDLKGHETMRVNFNNQQITTVDAPQLQDKSDRYYFQESKSLRREEVFVSEFDLNQEHGKIEQPLKPVLRFVTPVVDGSQQVQALLVLNYLGAELLQMLDDTALPGQVYLLRTDGYYLRGPVKEDAWGWLLGHERTFATQFPEAWRQRKMLREGRVTPAGAFAMKRIPLGPANSAENTLTLIWHLPKSEVFADSHALLQRLLALSAGVLALIACFSRPWARATLTREMQAQRIAVSEEQLRDLSSRLLRTQEDERRAVSREIHDDLGQQVTAINLDLKLAERNLESDDAKPHLRRAIAENETLLETLHDFARRVRPAVLDDLGLRDAIESHLTEFQLRTGIDVEATLDFHSTDVPNLIADNAYRLLQESLNNIAKHADATRVWIDISLNAEPRQQFTMRIRDNGCGQGASTGGDRLGLIGMRERVDLLAGEFQMASRPNEGTLIDIRLPTNAAPKENMPCH